MTAQTLPRAQTITHLRIWRSLRFLARSGSVTSAQIANHARTTEEYARKILRRLELTGYLRVMTEANARAGKLATYRLIRNSGPDVPIFRWKAEEKGAYDPNSKEFYPAVVVERGPTARQQALAWMEGRTMWTVEDLVAGSGIEKKNGQKFLTQLVARGLVRILATIAPGPEGGNAQNLYELQEPEHAQ